MIGTGALNFVGPPLAHRNFAHWGYPAGFHRVAGSLAVVLGLLLVIPVTSRGGALGSAIFMLAAVATLIRRRDWGRLPVAAVITATSIATEKNAPTHVHWTIGRSVHTALVHCHL